MNRVERRDDPGHCRDRVGRAVGVSDVALNAGNVDPHVDRAAAADLDRVAEPVDRGRLADQDHVGADLPLVQPVDDPRRAVGGIAFLVAGDQQRQRALGLSDPRDGGDEGGDRALHVVGAAADQPAVDDLACERVDAPAFAGRDHVEVAGEAEMRRARAADRHHVLGRPVGRLAHHPAVHGEAERRQRRLEHVEHLARCGGDAGAVD